MASSQENPGHCVPSPISNFLFSPQNDSHSLSKTVDITIIGGGACGLAVASQIITRLKHPNPSVTTLKAIHSLIMIEKKSNSIALGLAYSQACTGSIINMHSDTMGLCPINPLEFTHWIRDSSPQLSHNSFPSRQYYGEYLTGLLKNVIEEAKVLGIDFEIVNKEVVDIEKTSDDGEGGTFKLVFGDDTNMVSREVVLALGNFCCTSHGHFNGNEAYFRCPWPISKFNSIDPETPIFILGSRLTAIDTVNALVENGHTGKITMISRSGLLPKVQGKPEVYAKRYGLYSMAKEFESDPKDVLKRIIERFTMELRANGVEDLSPLWSKGDTLETLKSDLAQAEAGSIPWQTVIFSTKAVVERYWNCFTVEEQKEWLRVYNSIWVTYRHSVPIENARKVIIHLEKGQLEVSPLANQRITWDDTDKNFILEIDGVERKAGVLIETLGQEFDLSRISNPLLQNLLSSGLLKPHPVCGLSTDFNTLKTSSGFHVIGSLTKGVHFYTTAIDRNAAHASRIADSLIGLAPRRPLHIAFFIGSDIFSHLMLSQLVPELLALGHIPFIFEPVDSQNSPSDPKPKRRDLKELIFWERTILQSHIVPFLSTTIPAGAKFMTTTQMASKYGILVQSVPKLNSETLLSVLRENHIDIGFSLRCYQKFLPRIINFFNESDKGGRKRALLNLHPGKLPEYRGVMTRFRAMVNREDDFAYSLHSIDAEYDSGAVIDVRSSGIDYEKTMLGGVEDCYRVGVEMVRDAVEMFARGKDLKESEKEQDKEKARYWGFPSEKELLEGREKGVRLVDGREMREFLVGCFAGDEVQRREKLGRAIDDAAREFYDSFS